MKAVLFPGNKKVEVVDRAVPVPGFGEVLVKMRASALCRSDMSLYYGKPVVGGEAARTGLVVPGHEPAGEVIEVGPGATGVTTGRPGSGLPRHRLRTLPVVPQRLSDDVSGVEVPRFRCGRRRRRLPGGPAINCLKLPDELSFEAGAVMTDMVGTQYSAQKRIGSVRSHDSGPFRDWSDGRGRGTHR